MEDAMKWLLFAALLISISGPSPTTQHRIEKRQAKKYDFSLWRNGIIFYRYVFDFTEDEKKLIRSAMDQWEKFTCVRFKEATAKTPVTVDIQRNVSACFSNVGSFQMLVALDPTKKGIHRQVFNLGQNCMKKSIIIHELGHSIGLYHEHERTNRDKYVELFRKNIQTKFLSQFKIGSDQRDFGLPYSYRSIMHYGKTYFTNGNGISMLAKDPKFVDIIGMVRRLAFKDIQIVNLMYRCSAKCRNRAPCPQGAMRAPNCRCWCRSDLFTAVDCETGVAVDKAQAKHRTGYVMKFRDGQPFFWSKERHNWNEANQGCKRMDGHLVDVTSTKINARLLYMYFKLREAGHYEEETVLLFWTGGNDRSKEGEFRWTDNTRVNDSIVEFPRGEPNNKMNEDCLAFAPLPIGNKFIDYGCGAFNKFVCELPKSGCHDRSTMCKYFKSIGECHTATMKSLCKRTCSLCSSTTKPPTVSKQATTTPPETVPEQATTASPEPESTSQNKMRCYRASCRSSLMVLAIYRFPQGTKFCVHCPACKCDYGRLDGFVTYTMMSTVCCAVLQMKGYSEGSHVLTRQGVKYGLRGGVRNGVRSSNFRRGTRATFSVDADKTRALTTANGCYILNCKQTFMQQPWYKAKSPGTKFCIQCPSCSCTSTNLWGYGRYSHNSPPCCAAKQVTGQSKGEHQLKTASSVWNLAGGTSHNITSRNFVGVYRPWSYTYEVISNTSAESCSSTAKSFTCGSKLGPLSDWKQMIGGDEMCIICGECQCQSTNRAERVYGFGVYHAMSSTCCAAKQVSGQSGLHRIRKVRGALIYRSGRRNGVTSSRAMSTASWAFEIVTEDE